jgi:hypothetical protein
VLAGLVAGFLALCLVEVVVLRIVVPDPYYGYVVAAGLAAATVGLFWVLHTLFLTTNGPAIFQLRGAWGEDNTIQELKKARRRRLVWGWVNSAAVASGDIDHLVVTRRGGVVVVDSKWCSALTDEVRAAMVNSARRAALRAEGIVNTVSKRSGGRHRGSREARVITVVVLWGAGRDDLAPGGETSEGVVLVRGGDFCTWLSALQGPSNSKEWAGKLLEEVRAYDQYRRATQERAAVPVGNAQGGRP